jgi:hypothetical protein
LFSLLHLFPQANPRMVMMGALSMGGITLACAFSAGFAMLLLLPVLVIRIVHEDVLMGTTAFWLTRPVSREKLLGAKALLISVLLVPPVLLGGMMNATFSAGHFWAAELAWVAAFAAFASITSGARDFMIYAVAFVVGKSFFASLLGKLWSYLHVGKPFVSARALHLNAPDFYHLCYFAGFTGVFIHQYLTLRTRKSLAILIGVLVAVSLLEMMGGAPSEVTNP